MKLNEVKHKINKLDVFETEFISKKLQNLKASVINKSGKILQFRDDEITLVFPPLLLLRYKSMVDFEDTFVI